MKNVKQATPMYALCNCNHEYLLHHQCLIGDNNFKCRAVVPENNLRHRGLVDKGIEIVECPCSEFQLFKKVKLEDF